MITYVNTVLVSNLAANTMLGSLSNVTKADAGKFVMQNMDTEAIINSAALAAAAKRARIGVVNPDGKIKWSNTIVAHDVKGLAYTPYAVDSADTCVINLAAAEMSALNAGGKRVIVRITYKDLPTRYRKWTESYEIITSAGEQKSTLATKIADAINNQPKRARVTAVADTTSGSEKVTLTAMEYTDDNSVDSISPAAFVRFDVNMYYTNPQACGFASKNKYPISGVTIVTTPGRINATSAKLVRDAEASAMGYQGILNRGEGTWPIIKPTMVTDLDNSYEGLTLEFENMYRAADDIFRKTKQTVNIYGIDGKLSNVKACLDAFIAQEYTASED